MKYLDKVTAVNADGENYDKGFRIEITNSELSLIYKALLLNMKKIKLIFFFPIAILLLNLVACDNRTIENRDSLSTYTAFYETDSLLNYFGEDLLNEDHSKVKKNIRNYTIGLLHEKKISEKVLQSIYYLGASSMGFSINLLPVEADSLQSDPRIVKFEKDYQLTID